MAVMPIKRKRVTWLALCSAFAAVLVTGASDVQVSDRLNEAKDTVVRCVGMDANIDGNYFFQDGDEHFYENAITHDEGMAELFANCTIEQYFGTAETMMKSNCGEVATAKRLRNAHWEMILKCKIKNDSAINKEIPYLVNISFGNPRKCPTQGKGMMCIQLISVQDLEASLQSNKADAKEFKSDITGVPVIPTKKFYKKLNWCKVEKKGLKLSGIVKHLQGHSYSLLANTNADPTVDNCQTMTRKIKAICKGEFEPNKWNGAQKVANQLGTSLANCTVIVPLVRSIFGFCTNVSDKKWMLSKNEFIAQRKGRKPSSVSVEVLESKDYSFRPTLETVHEYSREVEWDKGSIIDPDQLTALDEKILADEKAQSSTNSISSGTHDVRRRLVKLG